MNFGGQLDLLLNTDLENQIDKKKKIQFFNEKNDCLGNISEQTFDNFLVSPSNHSVLKIIKNICDHPGEKFPLIYIVGRAGLGKTHLIHASYKELSKKASVYFSSSRDFLEFYQDRCEKYGHRKTLRDFVNAFNVLILDDIDEVFGSKDFQNYFCHLYNHFSFKKKQIILSGFTNPQELKDTVPKFYSRISAGLIQEIKPMDEQLASSYLEMLSIRENIGIDDQIKKQVLENCTSDGRSLKSALTNLQATNLLSKEVVQIEKVFDGPMDECVVRNISRDFSVDLDELYSPSRRKELILARHAAMYLLNKVLGISFFKVGKKFNRDHTSVIYAVSKIEEKIKVDEKFSKFIGNVTDAIRNKNYFSAKKDGILYH